jgi:hypothetical protein
MGLDSLGNRTTCLRMVCHNRKLQKTHMCIERHDGTIAELSILRSWASHVSLTSWGELHYVALRPPYIFYFLPARLKTTLNTATPNSRPEYSVDNVFADVL